MTPRKVRISLEVTTDAPLKDLKDRLQYVGIELVDDNAKLYRFTVHQVLVDVQQSPKAAKGRKSAR